MSKNHLSNVYTGVQKTQALAFCEEYKQFLNHAKTERLAIDLALQMAQKSGYVSIDKKQKLVRGDKVYLLNQDKNLCLVHIGQQTLTNGLSIVATHIDSPRLDLKPQPIYEDCELALLKTQYYGGIKKYQWGSRALALHGIVCLKNERQITVHIGDNEGDPVFVIPDLLPHLDTKVQRERKANEVLRGEELRIVVFSTPLAGKEEEKGLVQKALLTYLKEHYGIEEEDFLSADLHVVPAGKCYDVGLDRTLIGGYGQDDRVCSYAGLQAILRQNGTPEKTAMLFLADKEEIGSVGITGMKSSFWRYAVAQLLHKCGHSSENHVLMETLWNSICFSGDVTSAVDPIFKEVYDEQNSAKLHYGLTLTKYTGSGGKYHASEADAALVASLRRLLSEHQIAYQIGQLGKVDEGGGGTVAAFFANHGVRTLDCGVAILSMHSPFEIASKWDIYAMFQAYQIFFDQGL